jgi:NADPH:quinone reductase
MTYGEIGQRVVVSQFGEEPLEAIERYLTMEEQPPPDPGTLAPTDVVIAVKSAAVGWVDLLMTSGQYQHMAKPPYTPGLEYSGVVVWAGSKVATLTVGQSVIADGVLTGPRSKGEHQSYGGFASYAVAPQEAALPLPETLTFDQGCNLLGNYETAYHCLIARGKLQPRDVVLVHGASGSTGLAAVHVAKRIGATVIATGRNPKKLEAVKAQGADHVVCTASEGSSPPRFREQVKELTGGHGVDVVYDGVGGAISLESLRCVKFGARFLIVGWAATPFVAKGKGARGAPRANTLPTNLIMMKGLNVLGCPTIISTHHDPTIRPNRLEQIMSWVEAGELTPHVGATFPMSRVKEALRAKWSSQFVGGCVVRPGTA